MEVHHHAHDPAAPHHQKNWKNYFWEFFMLFLAVICGFIAEVQFEHYVEHQREKRYMQTMLEDLKSDTSILRLTMKRFESVNRSIDSVVQSMDIENSRIDYFKIYRNIHEALNYWGFTYNDRTIAQLKNSGSFRLIQNQQVALQLIAYDQFNQDAVENISVQHNEFYLHTCFLRSKIFDERIISLIEEKFPSQPAPTEANQLIGTFIVAQKNDSPNSSELNLVHEFRNSLLALKRNYTKNMLYAYNGNLSRMNELIHLIQQTYHLN